MGSEKAWHSYKADVSEETVESASMSEGLLRSQARSFANSDSELVQLSLFDCKNGIYRSQAMRY